MYMRKLHSSRFLLTATCTFALALACSSSGENDCDAPGAQCGSSEGEDGGDSTTADGGASTGPTTVSGSADTGLTAPTSDPSEGPATTPESESMGTGETAAESSTGVDTECIYDRECDEPTHPLCIDGACAPCTAADTPDDACAQENPGLPVCGNNGECLECTPSNDDSCMGATPWCDPASNTCVPCTAHDQCGVDGCALDTGECLDACHIEVDGDGGADTTSIAVAVAMVDDGTACSIVVHEQTGDAAYVQSVPIADGKRIALLAADGEHPLLRGSGGAGISVTEAATLYARGFAVRQTSTYEGLIVSGAGTLAYVDDFEVFQNGGGGILVASGGDLRLRNTMVGTGSGEPAVEVVGASLDALYSTFGGGFAPTAIALECGNPDSVVVRNSLIVGREQFPELDCDEGDITHSASLMAIPGTGNVALGPVSLSWFVAYDSDMHLATPPAVLATTAVWESGDPSADIDGDARPVVDGATDYAGADVP